MNAENLATERTQNLHPLPSSPASAFPCCASFNSGAPSLVLSGEGTAFLNKGLSSWGAQYSRSHWVLRTAVGDSHLLKPRDVVEKVAWTVVLRQGLLWDLWSPLGPPHISMAAAKWREAHQSPQGVWGGGFRRRPSKVQALALYL